jgi:arabinogalactan oligomer / maltooligosaccharide transport system substrate-binding protein
MIRSGWKLLALLLPLLLVLAACGADEPEAEAPPEAPDEEAPDEEAPDEEPDEVEEEELSREGADLWIWADDTRAPAMRPFAEDFGEQEGLEVRVTEVDFGEIRDRLNVAGPAGEGPDIIIGAHDWLGELVANGVVEPVDLSGIADQYIEAAVQAFTYDGQTYGLPYGVENIGLVRNTDHVPDAPGTFDELAETALALQEDGTVERGLVIQASDVYHHYPFVTAHGGYVFAQDEAGSYDAGDVGIDSEGGLAAATTISEWVADGLLNPDVDYDVMINTFSEGNAAFAITGPWALGQFRETGVPYAVSPIPSVHGGTPAPFVGVQGFMISSFAENPLLAQTFVLDYMGTAEAQVAMFEADPRPPALLSAFEQVADDPDVAGFGASGQNGVPMPAIPEMGAVWSAWEDAYQLIYEQQGDPQEHFANAANQVRETIAQ